MDELEIIVKLSTELSAKRAAVDSCIAVIRGLVTGEVDIARITLTDNGFTMVAEDAAPEAEGD